ncbi:MAG: right-handed parallel beta-helix repeat-containing protein [Planctomycetota bacterium]
MQIAPTTSSLLTCLVLLVCPGAFAAEYHVDDDAKGVGDGSAERPFATIQQAADLMRPGDVCLVREGVYRETVRPKHSGTQDRPIVFRAFKGHKVVLSGCQPVSGWKQEDGNLYSAQATMRLGHANQVFAGGTMLLEARWPNAGQPVPKGLLEFETATMDEGTTPTKIVDDALPTIDLTAAHVWVSTHKRWYCWTGAVKGQTKAAIEIEDNSDSSGNHVCKPGGDYYLFGARSLLDSPGEWFYDERSGKLLVYGDGQGGPPQDVEFKVRKDAFDLRGRQHITIEGLELFGASLSTDEQSADLVLDRVRAFYVDHSNRATEQYGSQSGTGILLAGRGHVMRNCEIAYSSGNCVVLAGRDSMVVNNYIHDGNYMGTYAAPLSFRHGASDNVVSHNTISRSGRTTINTAGFYRSLLQYNDVGFAGYLSYDLGLTYANGVEGGNSEVRYNWLHDNVSEHLNMGLYFDHGCKNLVFHHNVIWNVDNLGMINNQYANYLLYYNNTVSDARVSYQSAWAAAQAKDLYGCQLVNNLGTSGIKVTGEGLLESHNTWNFDGLRDKRFPKPGTAAIASGLAIPTITEPSHGTAPDRGAYQTGAEPWRAGHDFESPPERIDTTFCKPPARNRIVNAAFYRGEFEPWRPFGGQVRVIRGSHSQWITDAKVMMGGYSAELGAGRCGLRQKVEGLEPGATYELMAMFRVPEGAAARLRVEGYGGPPLTSDAITSGAPHWKRSTLRFTLGQDTTAAEVVLEKISGGTEPVYVDDPGLQVVE